MTFHETCDQCHIPVEWHTANPSDELARLRAIENAARELLDYSQVYKGGKYVRHLRTDADAWEALRDALGEKG